MKPAREDLRAYRWAPMVELFPFEGLDMTGATFAMEVRLSPDAPGDALVSLGNAVSNAQGISLDVEWDGVLPTSIVQVRINETTLEGLLPFPANGTEPGEEVRLAYDLHITMPDFGKRRWVEGVFIIVPGVTQ